MKICKELSQPTLEFVGRSRGPEPSSFLMLILGLTGLGGFAKRRKSYPCLEVDRHKTQ